VSVTDNRASRYAGAQAEVVAVAGRHNLRVGLDAFAQHDRTQFQLTANDGSGLQIAQEEAIGGHLVAGFVDEQFQAASWLTLNGGIRLTDFRGAITERAASPRVGAAVVIPRLQWVVRGFYGRYYQPPPLDTISGPLEAAAVEQGFAFLPLSGERDRQYEVGVTVPAGGWILDVSGFHTRARNLFDHDALGNSNIFLPLTIDQARIRGGEATVRSPVLWGRLHLRAAYSYQIAEGLGAVTGGLTDFEPPEDDYFFLDHDQRQTLSTVASVDLPRGAWVAGTVSAGSGFLLGDGPGHLPAYATIDLAASVPVGDSWSLRASVLNVTNRRYFVDQANTFGGTHFSLPRRASVEVRYRFHY
jgi:outer membrane receptor protein involved in Fe transport